MVRVSLVQMACGEDRNAIRDEAEARVRDAAADGAQIVCLQELFDAQYFPQDVDVSGYDLAEPLPSITTERMAKLAAEFGIVLIVPIYATAESIINIVQQLYGLLSMPILSAFIVGLLFDDVDYRAAILAVVFGVLLYGFFSFVWEPLHYIHMMFITLWSSVAFALLTSRFVFGATPRFRFSRGSAAADPAV